MNTSPAPGDEPTELTFVDFGSLLPTQPGPAVDAPAPRKSFLAHARDTGIWLRDTGLGGLGFALVLTVALAGWAASFIGLHQFGVQHMGLSNDTAWLVPLTFDGAPAGLSIVVARASTHGRSAPVWRLLIIAFTGLSSWINYQHIDDPLGRTVASLMPPSAVILFEGLMSEARAAAVRRMGRAAPRLHPLRWVFDFSGTKAIYRAHVLGLELPEQLQEAAVNLAAEPVPAAGEPVPSGPANQVLNQPAEPSANLALRVAGTSAEPVPEPAAEPEVRATREPAEKAPRTSAKRTGRTGSRTSRQQRKQPEPEGSGTSEIASPAEQVRQVLNLIKEHGYDEVKLGFVQERTGMSKTTAYNRLVEARANWSEDES